MGEGDNTVAAMRFVLEGDKGVYPVPQNAPCVSAGMNVPDSLQGLCPKATAVSPWYGVYREEGKG